MKLRSDRFIQADFHLSNHLTPCGREHIQFRDVRDKYGKAIVRFRSGDNVCPCSIRTQRSGFRACIEILQGDVSGSGTPGMLKNLLSGSSFSIRIVRDANVVHDYLGLWAATTHVYHSFQLFESRSCDFLLSYYYVKLFRTRQIGSDKRLISFQKSPIS